MPPFPRLAFLILILIFVVGVRFAMEWGSAWSLLLVVPIIAFGARDLNRWRRGSLGLSVVRSILRQLTRWQCELSFRLKRGLTHRVANQPTRYCPKCGYPMKPGRCPECGRESARGHLRRSPPGRIRRHKWRITAAAAALALYFGADYGYRHFKWEKKRSNETLLDLAKLGNRRAAAELEGRFRNGKLSKIEKQRLFDESLSSRLEVLSPFPSDASNLVVQLCVDSSLPTLPFANRFFLRYFEISVDGASVMRQDVLRRPESNDRYTGRWDLRAPNQRPGDHRVQVSAIICISSGNKSQGTIDLLKEHDAQVSVTASIEVVDRPSREFLEPVNDADTAAEMESQVTIGAYRMPTIEGSRFSTTRANVIRVGHPNKPLPLIAEVQVRRSGEKEYQKLGNVAIVRSGYTDYELDACLPSFKDVEKFDLRLVPRPEDIICHYFSGVRKYYDAEIERTNLKWTSSDHSRVYLRDVFAGQKSDTVVP